ncbi:MAG TPA: adenylyltransferase/cytidyltransferase family protein [Anaerolineales bacterium]|nr:adenylyltransferase/cytidyltransferase family protein [Anaerolineales bacterium]
MPVLTLPESIALRESLRAQNKRLVLTNGVFDLLHVGHLDYLEKARALGDALFIGINGDDSARGLKGEGRPFLPAAERARLVAALTCVDAAILFDDPTADSLLRALRPDVYVKGGDYAHKPLPETESANAVGAQIVLIDYLPDHSTSALIKRIAGGGRG